MWYSATATSGPDAMHVIYGGTFDPIHHGHLRLALEVSDALAVDRVHLVPCHIPPHRGDMGATSAQRLELIRLAITGEDRLRVDDRELQRAGASYTADTLRQLRQELGAEAPLVMVVGTDSFAGFDRWQDWQQIPELARSEEHTSELQSRPHLVCRLLLEKKKKHNERDEYCTM